ncbi:MAG TPA: hypothetical protein VF414_09485 [Thermoanaerobaculia bacterium]
MKERGAGLFCAIAGGGDAATGLLLVSAPALALRLLGIPHPGGDLLFLRLAGVFVGCVGLTYLYPWLRRDRPRRAGRIVAAFEITAGFRLAVALFLGVSLAVGALELPWVTVGFYDAIVALAQIGLLVRGELGGA